MSDMRMQPARFRAILEAYGATPARWPDAERQAALDFAAMHPEAEAWLAEACELDLLFEAVKTADHLHAEADQTAFETALERFAVTAAMPTNVVALRPAAMQKIPETRRVSRELLWGAGIGLAACLAGALFGVNLSLMSLSDVRVTSVLEQVAMIDGGD